MLNMRVRTLRRRMERARSAWPRVGVARTLGMSTMRPIRSITFMLFAGLALLLAGVITVPAQSVAASATNPLPVSLGTHRFGHLATPEAIVAKASTDQVGWWVVPPGADGVSFGPWSFDMARDGSIWLLDEVNHRLLTWQPGRPSGPVRAVPVADPPNLADFAVAGDGTIYVSYADRTQRVPGMDYNLSLAALSPTGQLRWKGPTIIAYFNAQLRVGPDGTLYWANVNGTWTPLTTPTGQLLTIAQQRQRTLRFQPLPGGLQLTAKGLGQWPHHEWRFTLTNQDGQVVRDWRVTSTTGLGGLIATPALVGGDPVVALEISQPTKPGSASLYEYLVLRLGSAGGTRVRFSLDAHAVWGDQPVTGLRVGPDGNLYQLRSSHTTGVSIARYSLAPAKTTPPTTTPGGAAPPSTVTPPATSAPAPSVTPPTTPPVQAQPAGRSVLPWVMAVVVPALLAAAAGGWLWYRRRHPAGSRRQGRHRPAH